MEMIQGKTIPADHSELPMPGNAARSLPISDSENFICAPLKKDLCFLIPLFRDRYPIGSFKRVFNTELFIEITFTLP